MTIILALFAWLVLGIIACFILGPILRHARETQTTERAPDGD